MAFQQYTAIQRTNFDGGIGKGLTQSLPHTIKILRHLNINNSNQFLVYVKQGNISGAQFAAQHIERLVRQGIDIGRFRIAHHNFRKSHADADGVGTTQHNSQFANAFIV